MLWRAEALRRVSQHPTKSSSAMIGGCSGGPERAPLAVESGLRNLEWTHSSARRLRFCMRAQSAITGVLEFSVDCGDWHTLESA